jgi:predicted nuclease of predicted toxin-antitoxin system
LVAQALRVLEKPVTHVGAEGQLPRDTPDEQILAHAKSRKNVIATTNHDMLLLCIEEGEHVVWLDPRGKQITRPVAVAILFAQIDEILERLEAAGEATVVRVLRTKVESLTPERAEHLIRQRVAALRARERKKTVKAPASADRLFAEEDYT